MSEIQVMNRPLELGVPSRFFGTYYVRPDVAYFTVRVARPWLGRWFGRRWWGRHGVSCLLVAAEGLPPSPFEAAGSEPPAAPIAEPGLRVNVKIEATPIERGRFGRAGPVSIRWKLRVDRWIEVNPLPPPTSARI